MFVEIWKQRIVDGKYQRYGSKVLTNFKKLAVKVFKMVSLATEQFKYGIVKGFESTHSIKVILLTWRYKDGSGKTGHRIVDVSNIVHLYRP